VQDSGTGTCSSAALQSHNGPLAGVCPYVVRSSSSVAEGPVPLPLVLSPSLPAAVDLSVCHVDELPLNLSVSGSVGRPACVQQTVPPPAHCHFTGRGVTADVLARLDTQWTGTTSHCDISTTAAGATAVHTDDALRSLNVLSAAAALRAETLDQRLALPSAAADAVTLSSLVDSCRQVRLPLFGAV